MGGWIADKVGGALVRQGHHCGDGSQFAGGVLHEGRLLICDTGGYFVPFFLLFLVLFAATGIGNRSTFRTNFPGI